MTYINEDGSYEIVDVTTMASCGMRVFASGESGSGADDAAEPVDPWQAIDNGWRLESIGAGDDDECCWTVRPHAEYGYEVSATNEVMLFGMETVYPTAEAAKQACERVEFDLEQAAYDAMDW